MRIVSLIARVLLGIAFVMFGLNGFLHFIPTPPMPPSAATTFFEAIVVQSHFAYFIFGAQLLAGLLVLIDQYLPFALVMLGAIIANILAFHITMQLSSIPPALVVTVLWFLAAMPLRSHFALLFTRKVIGV